jgi:hypothetical protein
MTNQPGFRTSQEEVVKLLEECSELRGALRTISAQLARIESRVKRAFPKEADVVDSRQRKLMGKSNNDQGSALTPQEALAEFDQAIRIAESGPSHEVDVFLQNKSPSELLTIAREVGLSFKSSKPSARVLIDALKGRLRESLMLSKHTTIHAQLGGFKSQ